MRTPEPDLVGCGDVIDCASGPWLVVLTTATHLYLAKIPYWDNELGYGKNWTMKDVEMQTVPRRHKGVM